VTRLARATVDLSAIRHNLAVAAARAPDSRVIAVLKANGYGHGLVQAARAVSAADALAVSCLEEAMPLREAGFGHRLVLLEGPFEASELGVYERLRLDPVVHAPWQIELLQRRRPRRNLDVWLKVDTGMHRLGFPPGSIGDIHARLANCPGIGSIRIMTHLACADDRRDATTTEQLEVLRRACDGLGAERSVCNSAGTLGWPSAHADWVRPGIMLYGASPFIDGGERPPLRAAMTLEARLIAVNRHRRGDRVGYSGTYECPEDMPVGVVSIGYGDGYPRHAPNGTPVLVNGEPAELVGRVSMDMICVDLRRCPDAAVGDPVVLWGPDLPAESIAERCGTIAYELFCQITRRVAYRYVDGAEYGED
jgi:alanine racemase